MWQERGWVRHMALSPPLAGPRLSVCLLGRFHVQWVDSVGVGWVSVSAGLFSWIRWHFRAFSRPVGGFCGLLGIFGWLHLRGGVNVGVVVTFDVVVAVVGQRMEGSDPHVTWRTVGGFALCSKRGGQSGRRSRRGAGWAASPRV